MALPKRTVLYLAMFTMAFIALQTVAPVSKFTQLLFGEPDTAARVQKLNQWIQKIPEEKIEPVFKEKKLVLWANDYHISPINDMKHLMKPLGVHFIDKSLSGHCHITKTCEGKNSLKVINVGNAMHLNPALIPQFYEAYKNDSEMATVDAFGCFLPPAMCELYEPFNKSLIIIAPTRYEAGRLQKDRWMKWNENLIRYSKDPKNIIGGNNLYDVEYIKYFTGIQPLLLPSFCGYLKETYNQSRPGFLVAPVHNRHVDQHFFSQLAAICPQQKTKNGTSNCTVQISGLRAKYGSYRYSDLTAHQGIIYIPYQVSVMSFFEQYRMNIPLFCPSVDLLTSWQVQYMVMNERTWSGVFGNRPAGSPIPAHPSQAHLPDPNNEQNATAIKYWIKFSDYYQMPHVTYYDSVQHLVQILENLKQIDLLEISYKMKLYNEQSKKELTDKWRELVKTIAKYSKNNPH